MLHTATDLLARFSFGQKVKNPTGEEAYICGVIYYADLKEWHYALSFGTQNLLADEIWYVESELALPDG